MQVAYTRTVRMREVAFTCTICGQTVTQPHYPSGRIKYCSEACRAHPASRIKPGTGGEAAGATPYRPLEPSSKRSRSATSTRTYRSHASFKLTQIRGGLRRWLHVKHLSRARDVIGNARDLPFNQDTETDIPKEVGERCATLGSALIMRSIDHRKSLCWGPFLLRGA